MQCAYVLHTYPALSQAFILREVDELRRRGWEVATFSVTPPPTEHLLAEADRREAARTVSLLPPRVRTLLPAGLRALRRPAGLIRALRTARADALPGLGGLFRAAAHVTMALIVWRELDRRGVRHIHTHFAGTPADVTWLAVVLGNELSPHGGRWTWSVSVHGPVEFYDLSEFRLARRVRQADFVVGISDFARSQLMALLDPAEWDKLHVVHCAVDTGMFQPAPARNGRVPVEILNVARLVPVKGHAVLIDAVARLVERGRAVHLTIVGDGELRPSLEAQVAERGLQDAVTLAGPVGQDDIRDLYGRADVFCLSSFAEGVPVVLMEAMAMEIPVVSTQIAGISELVEDDVNGLLVRPARDDLLAGALERLVDDSELRRRLGENGRRKVAAEFDPGRSAEQLSELLGDLVSRPAGSAA